MKRMLMLGLVFSMLMAFKAAPVSALTITFSAGIPYVYTNFPGDTTFVGYNPSPHHEIFPNDTFTYGINFSDLGGRHISAFDMQLNYNQPNFNANTPSYIDPTLGLHQSSGPINLNYGEGDPVRLYGGIYTGPRLPNNTDWEYGLIKLSNNTVPGSNLAYQPNQFDAVVVEFEATNAKPGQYWFNLTINGLWDELGNPITDYTVGTNGNVDVVPEPSTLLLFAPGLAAFSLMRRKIRI